MVDTSRLYKILVREREGEEFEKTERMESVFRNIKEHSVQEIKF